MKCQTLVIGFGLLLGLIAGPQNAFAQTSGIAGIVRDSTGAVLPGVTVEAASPALIEKTRTAVTDDQGQYKLVGLTPGEYSVTFTLSGFGAVRREGVALTANFSASVNADMKVGSIEESVTVSGESPTVDVHNVVQQNVLSRELFDNVPSGKTIPAYAAMTPGVSIPPTSQDVGGSKGEISVRMVAHGSRSEDQRLLQDGMRTNSAEGSGRGFFANPANAQEITIDLGGGTAENELGGVQMNLVPKDGGNQFSGYLFTNYTNDRLQSDNLTSELIARGLLKVNGVNKIWDVNGALGGPIKRDKLWFFTSHRSWGNSSRVAGVFENKTPQA
jgi:Carboxypeptidase regulatory-like domain